MVHAHPQAYPKDRGITWPRLYDILLFLLTRGNEHTYRNEVLDLAEIRAGHDVLDIGCGTGTQALEIHRRVQPGGRVTGVDLSSNMIAHARRKARGAGLDIEFERADAASLPFGDGRFDVVTITTVLHMIPEAKRKPCLLEASRVLKPAGRLLIIDYAGARQERRHWSAKHGRHGLFDLASLHGALIAIGFAKVREAPLSQLSLHALIGVKS